MYIYIYIYIYIYQMPIIVTIIWYDKRDIIFIVVFIGCIVHNCILPQFHEHYLHNLMIYLLLAHLTTY